MRRVDYNFFRGFGGSTSTVAPLISPSRVGYAGKESQGSRDPGRGHSSQGIIASPRLRFYPPRTTTKQPDLPERERPKCLTYGPLGFLFLALGLPALKHGAASSMRLKAWGEGGLVIPVSVFFRSLLPCITSISCKDKRTT